MLKLKPVAKETHQEAIAILQILGTLVLILLFFAFAFQYPGIVGLILIAVAGASVVIGVGWVIRNALAPVKE